MARACRGVRLRSVNSPEDNRVPPYAVRDSWSRSKQRVLVPWPPLGGDPARCLGLLGLALQALGCDTSPERATGPLRADSEAAVRLCGPAADVDD